MFSVTGNRCLKGSYTFAHEVAHNFGCNHDRGTENACNATGKYNYGYRQPQGEFKSIMAYWDTTNQCDNVPNTIKDFAQRFSNPNFLYKGKPMGTATEDNARQINERRVEIAGYYKAMNCKSDPECDDNDAGTVDTCNTDNAACVFTPATAPAPVPFIMPTSSQNSAPAAATAPTQAPVKVSSPVAFREPTKAPAKVPSRAKCRILCRLLRIFK
jgi:Metallo-peptidase family M12B Reprolysin-like